MIIELAPEDIILKFVKKKLANSNMVLKERVYFDQLPDKIWVSEEFAEKWQEIVKKVVYKQILNTFKFRRFKYDNNGQIGTYGVVDKEFWLDVRFKFSQNLINAVWNLIKTNNDKQILITPDDAMFFNVIKPIWTVYTPQKLNENKAGWVTIAYFLLNYNLETLGNALSYWLTIKNVELPLRFLLIELTETFLQKYNDLVNLENEEYDILRPNNVDSGVLVVESLKLAVKYWLENPMTFEDERYITSAYNNVSLQEKIDRFDKLKQEYETLKEVKKVVTD